MYLKHSWFQIFTIAIDLAIQPLAYKTISIRVQTGTLPTNFVICPWA